MSSKVKDFLVKYKKTIIILAVILAVFQLFVRFDYRANGSVRIDRLTSQRAVYCQAFGEYRSTCRLPEAAPVIVPIDGTPEPVLESPTPAPVDTPTPAPSPTLQVIPATVESFVCKSLQTRADKLEQAYLAEYSPTVHNEKAVQDGATAYDAIAAYTKACAK